MAKNNQFLESAIQKGCLDDRKIFVVADVFCSNGNSGRAWVFLKDDTMLLYACAGFTEIGELIDTIDLTEAKVLKSCGFVLASSLKLQAGQLVYQLKNFGNCKQFLAEVRKACQAA